MRAMFLVLSTAFPHLLRAEQDTRADAQMCGANSLALAASYVASIRANDIHGLLPPNRAPFSLHDLDQTAQHVGLRTVVLRWKDKRQVQFPCPAILHVRARSTSTSCDHFITCYGEQDGFLCVADYPRPPVMAPRDHVLATWDGDVLYLDEARGSRIAHLRPAAVNTIIAWIGAAILAGTLALVAKRGLQRPKLRQRLASYRHMR